MVWEGVLLELGPKSLLDIGDSSLLGENVNIVIRNVKLVIMQE